MFGFLIAALVIGYIFGFLTRPSIEVAIEQDQRYVQRQKDGF